MKRYGVTVKFYGTAYYEVDCPNGDDVEEYVDADSSDVDEWEIEVQDIEEVDPNE